MDIEELAGILLNMLPERADPGKAGPWKWNITVHPRIDKDEVFYVWDVSVQRGKSFQSGDYEGWSAAGRAPTKAQAEGEARHAREHLLAAAGIDLTKATEVA